MSRHFSEVHIKQDCRDIKGEHDNGLFFDCLFDDVSGLTLKNCDLSSSKFLVEDIRKALGFTLTLNCHSFRDVEVSELLMDLFLVLLMKTKGNDEKRKRLEDVVGEARTSYLTRLLERIE